METVVEVEVNAESKSEVSKTSSAEKSLKLIADPVVYQLVRVLLLILCVYRCTISTYEQNGIFTGIKGVFRYCMYMRL